MAEGYTPGPPHATMGKPPRGGSVMKPPPQFRPPSHSGRPHRYYVVRATNLTDLESQCNTLMEIGGDGIVWVPCGGIAVTMVHGECFYQAFTRGVA